jgi:protein subunit release factor A
MDDRDIMIQVLNRDAGQVVRITHIPTGIVAASCERRTLRGNKSAALKLLKVMLNQRGVR